MIIKVDEIDFIFVRKHYQFNFQKEEKCRGPTETEIAKETATVHAKNLDAVVENPSVPVDVSIFMNFYRILQFNYLLAIRNLCTKFSK